MAMSRIALASCVGVVAAQVRPPTGGRGAGGPTDWTHSLPYVTRPGSLTLAAHYPGLTEAVLGQDAHHRVPAVHVGALRRLRLRLQPLRADGLRRHGPSDGVRPVPSSSAPRPRASGGGPAPARRLSLVVSRSCADRSRSASASRTRAWTTSTTTRTRPSTRRRSTTSCRSTCEPLPPSSLSPQRCLTEARRWPRQEAGVQPGRHAVQVHVPRRPLRDVRGRRRHRHAEPPPGHARRAFPRPLPLTHSLRAHARGLVCAGGEPCVQPQYAAARRRDDPVAGGQPRHRPLLHRAPILPWGPKPSAG